MGCERCPNRSAHSRPERTIAPLRYWRWRGGAPDRDEEGNVSSSADLIKQLDTGWAALQAAQPRVEAGAPWPLSDTFDNSPEAYWFPPEVLAHVAELLERWLRVVNTIVDGSPEPVEFGHPSPDRLAGIERNRHMTIPELYATIGANAAAMRARLAELTDADLAKRARHVRSGDTTLGAIVSGSVTGHIDEHVRQIEALLAAAGR